MKKYNSLLEIRGDCRKTMNQYDKEKDDHVDESGLTGERGKSLIYTAEESDTINFWFPKLLALAEGDVGGVAAIDILELAEQGDIEVKGPLENIIERDTTIDVGPKEDKQIPEVGLKEANWTGSFNINMERVVPKEDEEPVEVDFEIDDTQDEESNMEWEKTMAEHANSMDALVDDKLSSIRAKDNTIVSKTWTPCSTINNDDSLISKDVISMEQEASERYEITKQR